MINSIEYDVKRGVVMAPQKSALQYRNAASAGIGIQVTPNYGPAFSLTLTRFAPEADAYVEKLAIEQLNGTLASITEWFGSTQIVYSSVFYGGLTFAVTQARVLDQQSVVRACGFRRVSGAFNFSPAVKVTCQLTMHAVKL